MARGGDAITTIQLRKSTRDRLKGMGAKGDTYDEILNRILDQLAGTTARRVPSAPASRGLVDFEPLE